LNRALNCCSLSQIDFFYIWYLLDRDDWHSVSTRELLPLPCGAKEEGLIKNLVCSSHMNGDDLAEVLASGYFSGVLARLQCDQLSLP
jgi:uncharacterized protein